MSVATRRALVDPPEFELRPLGAHRLRGIAEEQELFSVLASGLDGATAPLSTDL